MNVERPRHHLESGGHPFLIVQIDGEEAWIHTNQSLRRWGLVFLGEHMEEHVPTKTLIADPGVNRPDDVEVQGYTDDERVLALYDAMMEDVEGRTFEPGRVRMPGPEA